MDGELVQAGERMVVRSTLPWLDELLAEAAGRAWQPASGRSAGVRVEISSTSAPFDVRGWEPLTRGAYRHGGRCVIENACTSGFDVLVQVREECAVVEARWRPPRRERVAAAVLRSRFHLLARAVLVQYPAMWRAGWRGRVPLHAAAAAVDGIAPLLVGPGGVGRSTVLLAAAARGGRACSDNLSVADARLVYGVVEPVRIADGGQGRRMPHGRRERPLPGRVDELEPDRIVVLRRGGGVSPSVTDLDPERAAAVLTAGTYMAGELRRYWSMAATLALATGRGPAHPPVADVARDLAARLPAFEIMLAAPPAPDLSELLVQPAHRSPGARRAVGS